MKILALLIITLITLTGFFILNNTLQNDKQIDNEDGELQQISGLAFRADANCQIGSKYILGQGCQEPLFHNIYQIRDEFRQKSVLKTNINYYTTTDSSDILKLTQTRSSFGIGGFGITIRVSLDKLNKNHKTVNSVSVDLTDYRLHYYKYAATSQLELDQGDVDDFANDPEYFFEQHGYYYVIGLTTGSTYDGVINYGSTSSQALSDVKRSIGIQLGFGPFGVGLSFDYQKIAFTTNGQTSFDSKLNVTGSTNDIWDESKVKEMHDKFQQTINQQNVLSVTLSKWETNRDLRAQMSNMNDADKNLLREYSSIPTFFIKRISEAYMVYLFLESSVSDHIIKIGASLNSGQLSQLSNLKNDLNRKIDKIEELRYMGSLLSLYKQFTAQTDDLLEFERAALDVERLTKQLTGRTD